MRPFGAVRAGDWKLIEFYEDMRVELYNLKDDLGETHDLAKDEPAKAAELREMLHHWRQSVDAQMPTPNPRYDSRKAAQARPQTADPACSPARRRIEGRRSLGDCDGGVAPVELGWSAR